MDDRPSQSGSVSQRTNGLLTKLGAVRKLLDWLTSLFLLSDEQQEQAGIHLRRGHHE